MDIKVVVVVMVVVTAMEVVVVAAIMADVVLVVAEPIKDMVGQAVQLPSSPPPSKHTR